MKFALLAYFKIKAVFLWRWYICEESVKWKPFRKKQFQLVNRKKTYGKKTYRADVITHLARGRKLGLVCWNLRVRGINWLSMLTKSHLDTLKSQPGVAGGLQNDRITTLLIDSNKTYGVGTSFVSEFALPSKGNEKFKQFLHNPAATQRSVQPK